MAETVNISKMADIVSREIFKFFGWKQVGPKDTNYNCVLKPKHLANKLGERKASEMSQEELLALNHTHPSDVVFHYVDPYRNKSVYINTDLKSYAASSITSNQVRKWLKSLAVSIECANLSPQWKERYCTESTDRPDIIGMLFIYNHDGKFLKNFYDFFKKEKNRSSTNVDKESGRQIKIESLSVERNHYVSIFDPQQVRRLYNIVTDIKILRGEQKFPHGRGYHFFYPSLAMHRAKHDPYDRPATVEVLTDPCMIIWHDPVSYGDDITQEEGYLIYYNRDEVSYRDFVYLFDKLSNYQILEGNHKIRIRVQPSIHKDFRGSFERAIEEYSRAWGFDENKKAQLKRIEIEHMEVVSRLFIDNEVGRRD